MLKYQIQAVLELGRTIRLLRWSVQLMQSSQQLGHICLAYNECDF